MTIVGDSEIEIRPNTSGFSESLKGQISKALKNPAVLAAAAITTATAAVSGIVHASNKEFKELGTTVAGLQRLTGESAESMSQLAFVAKQTGVGTDALGSGLKRLSLTVSKNGDDLRKLGIRYQDAKGKALPLSQTLANVADKFEKMPAGVEKNALAMQLFGKQGTALLPILNKGSAGIAELTKQADKYGLTLTQSNLAALAKSKAAHKDLANAIAGVKVQIGAALFPVLTSITTFFISQAVPVLLQVTNTVKTQLAPAMASLQTVLNTVFAAIQDGRTPTETINDLLGKLGTIAATLIKDASTYLGAFVTGIAGTAEAKQQLSGMEAVFGTLGTVALGTSKVLVDLIQYFEAHPDVFKNTVLGLAAVIATYKTISFAKKTIDFAVTGAKAVTDVISGISSGLASIGDKVIKVGVEQAGTAAAKGAVQGAGSAAGNEVADGVISGAAGGALGNFLDIKAISRSFADKAGPALKNAITVVVPRLLVAVGSGLVSVASAIGAVIFAPEILIGAAVVGIATLAVVFRKQIWNFVKSIPGWIRDAAGGLVDFGGFLVDKGRELLGGLRDGAEKAFKEVIDYVTHIPEDIAFALGFGVGFIIRAGIILVGGLFTGAKAAFEVGKEFFSSLPGLAADLLGDVGSFLLDKGQDLLNGLWSGIKQVWANEVHFWTDLVPSVLSAIGDVAETLAQKGFDLLEGLWMGIKAVWEDPTKIIAFFANLPGNLVRLAGSLGSTLVQAGGDIIRGLGSGITTAWEAVSKFFTTIRDTVITAVKNPFSWLVEAGKDTIRGFLSGVDEAARGIASKAESIGGSFISGVKKGLGVKSPSWKTRQAAGYTMQGLMMGLDDHADALRKKVGNISADILKMTDFQLNMPTMGSAGYGGGGSQPSGVVQQFNLTVETKQSDVDVQTQFARMQRMAPPVRVV